MGRVKRKCAFEHAQNERINIILRKRKVSSGPLFFIDTFYGIHWFCKRRAKAQIRLRERAVWSGPSLSAYARRHVFAWSGQNKLVCRKAGHQRKHIQREGSDQPVHSRIISAKITFLRGKTRILSQGIKNESSEQPCLLLRAYVFLLKLDTLGRFCANFYNEENFCNFLFAFLHIKPLLLIGLL